MGGVFGLGHSSEKTDRGRMLGGWNAMWDTWSRAIGAFPQLNDTGAAATRSGLTSLDQSGDFWKSILGGDKAATAAAAAPATNAAAGMADQARQQQAQMGTARGGGTAGYNIDAGREAQSDIVTSMLGLAPTAATQLAQTGESTAAVGSRDLALALQALGISQQTATSIVDTSAASRQQSHDNSPARIAEAGILGFLGL